MSFAFLWEYAEFVRRWARWAEAEILLWPADQGPEGDVFQRALAGAPIVPPE